MQQPPQQMLVDPPQTAHANLPAELGEHPRGRELSPQPGESSPSGLFGQLRHDQVQGMGGGQHRQQMNAPDLCGAQVMPSAPGESPWTKVGDEIIGNKNGKPFKQGNGADRRQRGKHAQTLTESSAADTPLVSAQSTSHQPVAKTFGTPSISEGRF